MANGFYWKPTVGPLDQRPGHWNGMWQYWSTDGEPPASRNADCQQGLYVKKEAAQTNLAVSFTALAMPHGRRRQAPVQAELSTSGSLQHTQPLLHCMLQWSMNLLVLLSSENASTNCAQA